MVASGYDVVASGIVASGSAWHFFRVTLINAHFQSRACALLTETNAQCRGHLENTLRVTTRFRNHVFTLW